MFGLINLHRAVFGLWRVRFVMCADGVGSHVGDVVARDVRMGPIRIDMDGPKIPIWIRGVVGPVDRLARLARSCHDVIATRRFIDGRRLHVETMQFRRCAFKSLDDETGQLEMIVFGDDVHPLRRTISMPERVPAEVFPPGEFIREELEARGWTQEDLAKILGFTKARVNEVIVGRRRLTDETALALGEAFGTGASFWMNLETAYRLQQLPATDDAVARRSKLYAAAPIRDLVRHESMFGQRDIESFSLRTPPHRRTPP